MLIEEQFFHRRCKGRISVSNTKVTAVTAPRILVFIYHLWHNDYRKEILFAGFVETTEMSLTTHSCHKE